MTRRIVGLTFTLLFVVAAVVQRDDPDSEIWMGVYGIAALASALFALGVLPRLIGWTLGFAAIVWGGGIYLMALQNDVDMTPETQFLAEEAREAGGLAVIGLWLFVAGAVRRRRSKSDA